MSKYGWKPVVAAFVLITIVGFVCASAPDIVESFGNQILRLGTRGGDVYELQGRLAYLDYYRGKVDGVFGSQTDRAVRDFQYRFGMKVDGVVGPQTKNMLVRATSGWRAGSTGAGGGGATGGAAPPAAAKPSGYSAQDIRLMAQMVHGEARGEPYVGQVAVAAVIINRLKSPSFPNTISGVLFQPGAFTAVDDGQMWLQPDDTSYKAVNDALNGWDPSGGAIYYFNPITATSKWIWSRPQIKQIGRHIFCR